jgi:hypothetical protein
MKPKKTPTAKLPEIREELLDEALQETFPASDPIACTPASRVTIQNAHRTSRTEKRGRTADARPAPVPHSSTD